MSCNVHTQARDVGWLVNESAKREDQGKYILESLRGFDLFPQVGCVAAVSAMRTPMRNEIIQADYMREQTAHVESVAVLRLVE